MSVGDFNPFDGVLSDLVDAFRVALSGELVRTLESKERQKELSNGDAVELSLEDTEGANFVSLLIDDGAGGTPDNYDITIRHWNEELAQYQPYFSDTDRNERSWGDSEVGRRWQVQITKNSAGTATYRLGLEARRR